MKISASDGVSIVALILSFSALLYGVKNDIDNSSSEMARILSEAELSLVQADINMTIARVTSSKLLESYPEQKGNYPEYYKMFEDTESRVKVLRMLINKERDSPDESSTRNLYTRSAELRVRTQGFNQSLEKHVSNRN